MDKASTECFKIYANCIPVKGARRSVICDLQNNNYYHIPNDLYDFIMLYDGKPYDEILKDFEEEAKPVINEYLQFMTDNELAFFTTNPGSFTSLPLQWDEPSLITNAIIDNDRHSNHNWSQIYDQLETVGCRDIQIRSYDEISFSQLSFMLDGLENRRIKSVELIVKFTDEINKRKLNSLVNRFPRIKNIFVHSSPKTEIFRFNDAEYLEDSMGNIFFITQSITDQTHCGQISPLLFTINVKTFTESQKFNSCLNRKVGIDVSGAIKNCPSFDSNFGNINEVKLLEVVSRPDFQVKWHINKSSIETCQDCEYRHICTDCRAYTMNGKRHGKPAKCGYNPYAASWEAIPQEQ